MNTKTLLQYDKNLLERLTSSKEANILEDTELIEVLNNTKAKAREVQSTLIEAAER
jgi:dynein heavy chain